MGDQLEGSSLFNHLVDFEKSLSVSSLDSYGDKEVMLDISTSSMPITLIFQFTKVETGWIVFGRQDLEENLRLVEQITELNREMSVLTRRLNEQNRHLDELNHQKNKFVGIAAHDLRNPAAYIYSSSTYLIDELKEHIEPDNIELLEGILTESEDMMKLIHDFLDISLIESGHFELHLKPTPINDVIQKSLNVCQTIAKNKQISVETKLGESLPTIMIDESKMEEVICNLLTNAIQHSYSGSSVSIETELKNDRIEVSVNDEGVGIPDDVVPTLFQYFSKGKTTKTNNESSSGLGLAISKKIVTAHGGKIWIEPGEERGTTFRFSMPVK